MNVANGVILGALLGGACTASNSAREPPSVTSSIPDAPLESNPSPTDSEPSPELTPSSRSAFVALPVEGFLPAVVYVPETSEPRPLLVASHGAGGDPEGECEYWRALTGGRAFLLCLRGTRIDVRYPSGFYYKDHFELGREFSAAVAALRREFGGRLLANSGVYAGFSQGAIMGAPMIVTHASGFSRLALIEGGYEYWSPATARTFVRGGGKRVLFSCGTRWCKDQAEKPASLLRQAGVLVLIEYAEGTGHTPSGEVMKRTAGALPWLLEGQPGWGP